jgi:hypothetical protein
MTQNGDSCKQFILQSNLTTQAYTPFSAGLVQHPSPCPPSRNTTPSRSRRAPSLRLRRFQTRLQHSPTRLRPLPHPHPKHRRLLLSRRRPPIPESTRPQLCALPLAPLWHRRAHCDRLCALAANRIYESDRPMSAAVLDRCLPGNARLHRHGQRHGRCGY